MQTPMLIYVHWYIVQALHETDESLSPAILRAVYEIRGSGVLEKWVVPVFGSLIYSLLSTDSEPLTSGCYWLQEE